MSQQQTIGYQPVVPDPTEATTALASHAQNVIGEIVDRLGGLPAAPRDPLIPLFLFDSAWAYNHHMENVFVSGAGGGSEGAFYYHPDVGMGIALFTRDLPVFDLMTTVQHECLHHAALLAFGPSLPRWINEGLAQYFQDALWHGGRLLGGMVNPDRLERLRHPQYRRAGLAELLDTPDGAWFISPSQPGVAVSRLYESAWLIVYALIAGPSAELRAAFARYLGLLKHPAADHERAWRLAMASIPAERVDAAASEVMRGLRVPGVCDAIHKMTLLATILSILNQHHLRMPATIEEAGRRLRLLGIEVHRRVPGSEPIRYHGDDERLYHYEIEDGLTTSFELRPAENRQHPPILSAPGVLGCPRVRWTGRGRSYVPWIELDETETG